jgi:Tfp pilus assembly protein PilF
VANEELQNLLRTGIQAAQSGNKAIARRILEQVTEQDPRNELAWIWLASIADSAAERRTYLQKVLEINPQNERARQALEKLEQPAPSARCRRAQRCRRMCAYHQTPRAFPRLVWVMALLNPLPGGVACRLLLGLLAVATIVVGSSCC